MCTIAHFLANAGRKATGYLGVLKYETVIQLKVLGHRHDCTQDSDLFSLQVLQGGNTSAARVQTSAG